jgi:hypothetical protein
MANSGERLGRPGGVFVAGNWGRRRGGCGDRRGVNAEAVGLWSRRGSGEIVRERERSCVEGAEGGWGRARQLGPVG